jgi:hypothetical protein
MENILEMKHQPDQIYIHKKSQRLYCLTTDNIKIQVDGKWCNAVLYRKFGSSENEPFYARPLVDFEEKFEVATDGIIPSINF